MELHRYNKAISEIKKATRMFDAEKSVLIAKLSKYADENPPLELRWPALLRRREFAFILAALVILIIGSGGSLAAAERALPGDFLYPIKLGVTEPLRRMAAGSAGQADFYAWTTGRRLAEAETLAVDGRLSGATQEEVKSLIEKSTASFFQIENQLNERGSVNEAAAARREFDAEIGAHSRIIQSVKGRTSDGEGNSQIDPIEQTIKNSVSISTSTKSVKNPRIISPRKVENLIEKTRQDIDRKYGEASGLQKDILDGARSALDAAENSFKESRKKTDKADSDETDESLGASLQSIKEANISVEQSSKLKEGRKARKDREE